MTDKIYYKKIRTDIINGKKRCIYMKPKGKREYVKSGGDFVLLSAYIKALQKKIKNKRGGMLKCFGLGKKACNKSEKNHIVTAHLGFVDSTQDPQVDPRNITTQPPRDEWEEKKSRSKDASYYFNRRTGESTWERPSSMKKPQQSSITHSNGVTRVFRI
jgi:hypothetical protein